MYCIYTDRETDRKTEKEQSRERERERERERGGGGGGAGRERNYGKKKGGEGMQTHLYSEGKTLKHN